MSYVMNRIEEFFLRRLCRRLVAQGPTHKDNVTRYYRIMTEAAEKEFTEDSRFTLNLFLMECHNDSLQHISPDYTLAVWGETIQ